jgi:hypothetical protein
LSFAQLAKCSCAYGLGEAISDATSAAPISCT